MLDCELVETAKNLAGKRIRIETDDGDILEIGTQWVLIKGYKIHMIGIKRLGMKLYPTAVKSMVEVK